MIRTSVELLQAHGSCPRIQCVRRWRAGMPEDELFSLVSGLDIPGILVPDDPLWALRAVPPEDVPERDYIARMFAADCAERALSRERKAGREPDSRSWKAVEVARRFATGDATAAKLASAMCAARKAAGEVLWEGTKHVAHSFAREAAFKAASETAWNAAWDVSWSAIMQTIWDSPFCSTAQEDERVEQLRALRALLRGDHGSSHQFSIP